MTITYEPLIAEIAQTVFSTMAQLELTQVDVASCSDHDSLLTSIHIAGDWTGSVVVSLSSGAARQASAAMLGMSVDEVSESDRREVASELTNIIGGNLKSLLPGTSFLSLPTTISGHDFEMHVRNAVQIDDVVMSCEAGLLRLRLYARDDHET